MISTRISTVELKRQAREMASGMRDRHEKRFCLECDIRRLPGDHRYQYGDRWEGKSGEVFFR